MGNPKAFAESKDDIANQSIEVKIDTIKSIEKMIVAGVISKEEGRYIIESTIAKVSKDVKKVKPSKPPNPNAVPEGDKTKIGKKVDDAEKRSLNRENESAIILAKEGYKIKQNPVALEVAPKKPDYRIEGQLFDCYAPDEGTPIKNILSTINEKVNIKKQANRMVVNLQDWDGNMDDLAKEFIKKPVKNLEEVIVITKEEKAISIFP
ncbi:UNVERIFIED_CONTAM: filamentous hemagglutinin [Acetivibrio alkalicellulosi]